MKPKPKYPAKINRPVFRNVLARKRLFSLLDEDGTQPLIWICGPAGFGKTTLISSYIDHKNIPGIWYQWDSGDKDPATFYYYLGLACRKETQRKREAIPSYTPEYAPDPEAFSQRFFETIFKRLATPALIVFDNLLKEPENYFLDILLSALSRIPPGLRIVVVSRSDPPPPLSILTVRNQMKVINVDDLRFDLEEFKKASTLYGISDVSEDTLEMLHQRIEGWVTGLMLIAESYRRTEFDLDMKVGSSTQEIYDFFAGEIDKELDSSTKDFLVKTSFLPNITIQSAKLLTGYDRCEEVLNYLTSHNLFTSRRGSEPVTYTYHSLFREYLQKQADDSMSADQLSGIKASAANILKDTGQYEYAAALFTESRIWEGLTLLIIESAPEMLRQGRHHLLEEWLSTIPEDILSRDRYLQYWKGTCKFPFSPGSSRPYFLHSVQLAREAGDADTAYRAWAAAVESIVFEFNNLYELDGLIEDLEHLRAEFPEYPSKIIEGTVATAMLTALVFRQIEHPMIEDWARRAVSIALANGVCDDQIMVGLIDSMRHYYMGNMVDMRVTIETLVEPFEKQDVCLSLRTLVHYLLGLKEWTLGNMELSQELIEKGLKTAELTGVHIWDLLLLGQGANCALTALNMDLAQKYLERMNKLLGRASKYDQSHYHNLSAWAASLAGDRNLATSHAQKAYELKKEVGHPYGIGSSKLALAETLWAGGDQTEAMDLLAESRKTAELTGSGLLSYLCDVVEAYFALDTGDTERAIQLLRTAFAFGSAKGIYNFFWFRKDIMSRLCSLAIENDIMVSYTQELIRKHNLVPDSPAQELEDWPWPVKLYTLGRFELVVRGKTVKFTRKSQERPMSLLKAVVAMGGRNVSSFQLAEALWPDSDGATGQQTLATTLHRLRKLIGIEEAVIFSKGTVTLNPEVFWVDIWAVERAMGRISPALENGLDKGAKVTRLSLQIEKALDLYRGHFLSHDGSESWSITPRERLRSKFIRNLKNYCVYLEGQGEDKKAVQWYQKALELENLAEELYQELILCYHRLGQKADAISTYNRCQQVLSEVLGVEPSPATEAIREKVMRDA